VPGIFFRCIFSAGTMAADPNPESRILDPLAAAVANHLLRGAAWARAELKAHAGKTARFEVFPAGFSLTVLDSGEVSAAPRDAVASVTLKLSPGLMLRLAARDEAAWREVDATGDTDFAATINQLARNLRWDYEEDLSRVFGDIAAHRMAETGRTLRRWGIQSAEGVARSFTEYWTEELPLIVPARELETFNADVDALRDDVARIEKRVEILFDRR
jgi:ubiquinone biosynthesis protein UbiJ